MRRGSYMAPSATSMGPVWPLCGTDRVLYGPSVAPIQPNEFLLNICIFYVLFVCVGF